MITEKDIELLRDELSALNVPYHKKKKAEKILIKVIVYMKQLQNSLSKYRENSTGYTTDQLSNILKLSLLIGLDEFSMNFLLKNEQFIEFIYRDNTALKKPFMPGQLVYLARQYHCFVFEHEKEPSSLNELKDYIYATTD